jgi:hypothetical protein
LEPISKQIVDQIWQEQVQMEPANAMQLINRFGKEQPAILAYLMAAEHETYNQDERELLLYLGTAVWQMMRLAHKKPVSVSDEQIDEVEETNIKMVEYFMEEPSDSFEHTTRLVFKDYNQRYVLEYVLEALMEEDDEEELEIRDESKGLMFLNLKTVIDCLDK